MTIVWIVLIVMVGLIALACLGSAVRINENGNAVNEHNDCERCYEYHLLEH